MLFPTLDFGLFFLGVFGVSWALLPLPRIRLWFLIAVSYAFYAFWNWEFCFLLGGSSVFNWFMGRRIYAAGKPGGRKWLVSVAVAVNLGALGFFKYCNFFLSCVNAPIEFFAPGHDIAYLDIILPVGISFFTFHGISYIVDIYRGDIKAPARLQHILFYIAFFPQLVAGPIVRAAHFLPQLDQPLDPQDIRARRALLLILGGLFKKVVLANYLATNLVDDVFFDPTQFGAWDLIFADYGYAAQIYCDFSAYTDIAIGVAALLGYKFPWNFNQPYRAIGLQDFWGRWHISLSSWLRDYLYIPLGGNRHGELNRYRNLFLTMLIGGLWHGASWNFVVWGAMHGAVLVVEHALFREKGGFKAAMSWLPLKIFGTFITFQFICFTWIFFRAADFDHAISYFAGFTRLHKTITTITPFNLTLVALAMSLHFLPPDWVRRVEFATRRIPLFAYGALAGALIVAIAALGPSGVAPFIYFQF
jgi:D-alanyl-lipoteichoic acid acyltransferase DltB (MBOAT superfamily)